MTSPQSPQQQPVDDRPVRSLQQMVTAVRMSAAKQQNLFFTNKKEAFLWEESLLR
jgi:hypothetical protein